MGFAPGAVTGTDDAPVITGVLLCGATSANKRRYLTKAFEGERVKRYNGVPVFLNHSDSKSGRGYHEQIGIVQNARHRADGMPVGDIAINPEKPHARAFLWDAKHQSKACGMSHVAHCETKRAADGWDDVTELVRVESVDVIAANGAATTKGLFEGKRAVPTTLRAVIEANRAKLSEERQKAARKFLLLAEEDAAMGAMLDAPVDEPADGGDAMDDAFKSLMHTSLDKLLDESHSLADFLKNIRAIYKTRAQVTGNGKGADEPDEPAEPPKESKQLVPAADVLAECAAAKFSPSYDQGERLRGIPDKDTRAVVIESFKGAAAIQTA
jgi:hypothetical protein